MASDSAPPPARGNWVYILDSGDDLPGVYGPFDDMEAAIKAFHDHIETYFDGLFDPDEEDAYDGWGWVTVINPPTEGKDD